MLGSEARGGAGTYSCAGPEEEAADGGEDDADGEEDGKDSSGGEDGSAVGVSEL